MKYKPLGDTGLEVSEISLGTVELGLDYGFPGTAHFQKPTTQEAVRLLHRAVDSGINLIDTARIYGDAEEIIGIALQEMTHRPYVASKVVIPADPGYAGPFPAPPRRNMGFKQLRHEIMGSIETSLNALHVDTIDLMLIHNTTVEALKCEDILSCFEEARQQGKIRFIGASTYGEVAPLEVLKNRIFQALQVPFNLLDQKMVNQVFPQAAQQKVGILVRSAFLKGVLTDQVNNTPKRLAPLRKAALGVLKVLGEEVSNLAEVALRFCLSFTKVSSVIVGVRSIPELESNLAALNQSPFPPDTLRRLRDFSIDDEKLVTPTHWDLI
jgi:aryl-alcohol dehydrogenase-like predicted oxidoreductase